MPDRRKGIYSKSNNWMINKVYLHIGEYEDGKIGEIFH